MLPKRAMFCMCVEGMIDCRKNLCVSLEATKLLVIGKSSSRSGRKLFEIFIMIAAQPDGSRSYSCYRFFGGGFGGGFGVPVVSAETSQLPKLNVTRFEERLTISAATHVHRDVVFSENHRDYETGKESAKAAGIVRLLNPAQGCDEDRA